jgi:hypothetical protein
MTRPRVRKATSTWSRIPQRMLSHRNQWQRDGLLHDVPVHAKARAARDPTARDYRADAPGPHLDAVFRGLKILGRQVEDLASSELGQALCQVPPRDCRQLMIMMNRA